MKKIICLLFLFPIFLLSKPCYNKYDEILFGTDLEEVRKTFPIYSTFYPDGGDILYDLQGKEKGHFIVYYDQPENSNIEQRLFYFLDSKLYRVDLILVKYNFFDIISNNFNTEFFNDFLSELKSKYGKPATNYIDKNFFVCWHDDRYYIKLFNNNINSIKENYEFFNADHKFNIYDDLDNNFVILSFYDFKMNTKVDSLLKETKIYIKNKEKKKLNTKGL